jgi:hypothetical protein
MRGAGIVVLYVIGLAALAAVSGIMLGQRRLRWAAIAAGVALAFLSAFVLRRIDLSAGIGIPAVAAVLAVNQASYLIGLMAGSQRNRVAVGLLHQQPDTVPNDGRDDEVRHEREGQQEAPPHPPQINKRRPTYPTR